MSESTKIMSIGKWLDAGVKLSVLESKVGGLRIAEIWCSVEGTSEEWFAYVGNHLDDKLKDSSGEIRIFKSLQEAKDAVEEEYGIRDGASS